MHYIKSQTKIFNLQVFFEGGVRFTCNKPEDLYHLIKKAVNIRKHMERNRKDRDSKFRLILVESRIHRLARYYKTKKVLPPNWKYESATAAAMVQ